VQRAFLGKAVESMNRKEKYARLIVITDEQAHDSVPGPNRKGYCSAEALLHPKATAGPSIGKLRAVETKQGRASTHLRSALVIYYSIRRSGRRE